MVICCTPKEREYLIECLSPENHGCINCPVFETCGQYTSCEEALAKGIDWKVKEGD